MNHHVTQGVRASAGCRTGLRPAGSTAVQATRGHSWIPGPPGPRRQQGDRRPVSQVTDSRTSGPAG